MVAAGAAVNAFSIVIDSTMMELPRSRQGGIQWEHWPDSTCEQ